MALSYARRLILLFCCVVKVQVMYGQLSAQTDTLDLALNKIRDPNEKVDFILEFLKKPENQYMEYTVAIELANRAFAIAQQTNYVSGKVNSMLKLGHYYFRKGDYKKAMDFAQQSKEMAEDLSLDNELATALRLIGNIYSAIDAFDHSAQYLFKSLTLFEKLKDKEGISQSLGNIGLDFYSQQDYKKALEYYSTSLNLAKEINSLSLIKTQYNNIAIVYEDLQKYDTAVYLFKKALEINRKLGDKLGQGINILNIGYDQMNKGDFDEACLSFQQSLNLFTEINNRMLMAEVYLNFGHCYQAANRTDQSILYFKKALNEGEKNGYYRIIAPASNMLNQLYSGKKDIVNSYKYVMLQKIAEDSLHASNRQILISKLELQYLYEKKEIERLQTQQAKNLMMIIIIAGLLVSLAILGLVFSRFRLKSKLVVLEKENVELEKEKIKSELDIKDKELTVNLISLVKKSELLSDISGILLKLERNAKGIEAKEVITLLSQQLRNSTDEKMLNEFSHRFQEVHAGFYKKLLTDFPDLTQNELKLCAYLRLNMSTKDIAQLTGQQILSIDKARYRLRKKLAISNLETNLVSFLSQF